MTNQSILTAVSEWAAAKGLDHEVQLLSEPPALLDLRPLLRPEELPSDHSGVCLTISTPEGAEYPGQIGFWLHASGEGSWSAFSEGDEEIDTSRIPHFGDDKELLSVLSILAGEFLAAA
jgi:hypothetical protein